MTRRSTREAVTRDPFGRLRLLRLFAGIVLLAAVSWEVLAGDNLRFSQTYLTIQLIVCLVFLADFFVRWATAGDRFEACLAPKWHPTVPYFEVVGRSGLFYSFSRFSYMVLKFKGRGR